MTNVWVLVCDAAKARIFEIRQEDPTWHVVDVVLHEGSRRKASELVGGRSGSRSSEGRSSELEKHLLTTVDKEFNDLDVHELSERLRDAVRVPVADQESIREGRKRPH